jgi:transcription-repair coupling factor (superfamily II helicase)
MDIEAVASRIRMLVPEARVAVAHGQMEESRLETIVEDFWRGEFDVLVCTTIIESGIDMPTVNTLVVDRAELLGLGQLHQLRGRVGRAGVKAYAYLFHAPNTKLTEEAYERLKTIGEAIELGSGFRIAMRDLEIRGAGSLLGHTQSGHIAAVGYDLYVKMVKEAIAYLNGEEVALPVECRIDIPVSATIPRSYIEKDEIRLETYKELADCQNDEAISAIQLAWQDRFGPVPDEAKALCDVTRIRNRALYLAMTEVNGVIQSSSFQSRLRITMVGFSPALSALVNLRRRFAKADFRDISKTLSIEVDSTLDPVEVILSIMDLLIERANIKSARIG